MMNPPPLPSTLSVDGHALVAPTPCQLPDICVFTGGQDDLVRIERKLSWHHPAIYLLLFVGILFYVILALIVRKTTTVSFCLTRAEQRKKRLWHLANWGVFAVSLVALFVGISYQLPALFVVVPVLWIANLVIYFTSVRLLYPKFIHDRCMGISGIPRAVLPRIIALDAR